jgi:hypothetical protein
MGPFRLGADSRDNLSRCGSLRPGRGGRASSLSRTRLITLINSSNMDSDSPGPINDEVIADSEGEMDEEDHPGNRGTLIKLWLL